MTSRSSSAWPVEGAAAVISAGAVLVAGAITLSQVEVGPLSMQMAQHLAVMNIAAPLAAAALPGGLAARAGSRTSLWSAALAQIVLLWAWHVPAVQQAAGGSMGWHLVLIGPLALAALLFWAAVLRSAAKARWGAVVTLLLTGKFACLLGALLIFAPRELYGLPGSTLEDQQLAGLLMVTACPLSYVAAGVVLAAQAMGDLERVRSPRVAG